MSGSSQATMRAVAAARAPALAALLGATLLVATGLRAEAAGAARGDVAAARAARFDVNRADASDLARLAGIGPTLAARIVSERERRGPFRSTEEMRARVAGFGVRAAAEIEARGAFDP